MAATAVTIVSRRRHAGATSPDVRTRPRVPLSAGHGTPGGRADDRGVLGEDAAGVARGRGRPGGEAARHLLLGDGDVEAAGGEVEDDLVAVSDGGDGAAHRRLGGD